MRVNFLVYVGNLLGLCQQMCNNILSVLGLAFSWFVIFASFVLAMGLQSDCLSGKIDSLA